MSPQEPKFNRDIWKDLEHAVRQLDARKSILETYVICGPLFYFDTAVKIIGASDANGVTLPIPHAYFKSVLTENSRGRLHMWSFVMPNEYSGKPLADFRVPAVKVEKMSGLLLWERLVGSRIKREKHRVRKIW